MNQDKLEEAMHNGSWLVLAGGSTFIADTLVRIYKDRELIADGYTWIIDMNGCKGLIYSERLRPATANELLSM